MIELMWFVGGIAYTVAGFGCVRFAIDRGWVPLPWQRWGLMFTWPVSITLLATRHGLV